MSGDLEDPPGVSSGPGPDAPAPDIIGMHHVRLPVSNVLLSRDWYSVVLGLAPILVAEDEEGVTGIVMRHRTGIIISLHCAPERAKALLGFAVLGLSVPDLAAWTRHLDRLGIGHSNPVDVHPGHRLEVVDPDGLVIELHTPRQPSADEA